MEKKLMLIINPAAGKGSYKVNLGEALHVLDMGGYRTSLFFTAGRGDATDFARAYAKEFDTVACIGGDGTLSEVISGLMELDSPPPLGYIPTGTTNDFAASMGLSHNPVQAARDILEGKPYDYDAGRFGARNFAYVASFGAFTRSSYIVPQNIKNALGHTAYVLGGISELSQIRKEHIRMDIDGEIVEDDFLFGAICNSTSIGGILTLDPDHVDMGDGLFEVMLVRMPHSFAELSECIRAVQSQDYNCEMITFRSAHHIRVEADPEMPWTLDGEKEEGHAMVEVENLHHAIHLIQRKETDA